MTPTVKQILQIENRLCTEYNVDTFAALKFDDNNTDDINMNLISFLDTYQLVIDSKKELSVYGYNVPSANLQELFEFANQLIESNSSGQSMSSRTLQFEMDTDKADIHISDSDLSILEKSVIRKFDNLLSFRAGSNILRKVKQSHIKSTYSIIQYV